MGGLWVDYNLESTIPGLFVLGEANFSDHGANRLGASALMQGLADGYFVIPRTVAGYLASTELGKVDTGNEAFGAVQDEVQGRIDKLMASKGSKTVRELHWQLGRVLWDKVGMARNAEGLRSAITEIQGLREQFGQDLKLVGGDKEMNKQLELAGRLTDYLELGELMAMDALMREESCGGHFREEHKTEEGEAKRDDENFAFVSAWESVGDPKDSVMHKEELVFEEVTPTTRSYK